MNDEIKDKIIIEVGLIPFCENKILNFEDLICEIAFLLEEKHPNFRGYIKIGQNAQELFNNPLCSICSEPLKINEYVIRKNKLICGHCYK